MIKVLNRIIIVSSILILTCNGCSKNLQNVPYLSKLEPISSERQIVDIQYYSDGHRIYKLLVFDFELQNSVYMEFAEDGTIICKGAFDVGTYDSSHVYNETVWYQSEVRNGAFGSHELNFHAKKSGVWRFYYPNGSIQMHGSYVNGFRNGIWNFYGPDSVLEIIRTYDNGKTLNNNILRDDYIIPPE